MCDKIVSIRAVSNRWTGLWTGLLDWITELDCWTGLASTGSNQTASKNNDASVALRTNSRSKLTLAYESARIPLSLNLLKQYTAIQSDWSESGDYFEFRLYCACVVWPV